MSFSRSLPAGTGFSTGHNSLDLRAENRTLKMEKSELVPRLEDAEARVARYRFDVSQAAKAISLLVGLLTTGRDYFRVALLFLSEPPRVGKKYGSASEVS
jgi:hypothetical protein